MARIDGGDPAAISPVTIAMVGNARAESAALNKAETVIPYYDNLDEGS